MRRADAEIIPPLSDDAAFWNRERPFLFLTSGRWRHHHTPSDTPEKLDCAKMDATARWLERFARASAGRDEAEVAFQGWAADDASTRSSLVELTGALAALSPEAEQGRAYAEMLADCDRNGRPAARGEDAGRDARSAAGVAAPTCTAEAARLPLRCPPGPADRLCCNDLRATLAIAEIMELKPSRPTHGSRRAYRASASARRS